ncbi:MAG: NADH-quinone oxidoreductase subunit NuoH, partial [SAR202 cluster bacterium]|nr:NADH-quinone oxidoreductase subunit NuoH [SAR202 cluster bacterium]
MDAPILKGGFDFPGLYGLFDRLLPENLDWLAYVLAAFLLAFVIINGLVAATALYTWFERRALGRFQSRLGPNRWGPFGLLQPIADVIKFMSKEDTAPEEADKPVFTLAPILFAAVGFIVFALIPMGSNSWISRLSIGLVFIVAITSLNTLAIFMAGWSSRNKYGMLGAMRGVAMLISYEIPMALVIATVALAAQSLSVYTVVVNQSVPFILVMPLGFFVFITAASAEMSRAPFDMIESESELGAGYHTEYSGMKFALFQLAEFMAPVIVSAIIATLFLSGWKGWWPIPGQVWFVLKVSIVLVVLLWARATWPRLRVDQIMSLAWKGLFPMALVNLLAIAIEFQLLRDPTTGAVSTSD